MLEEKKHQKIRKFPLLVYGLVIFINIWGVHAFPALKGVRLLGEKSQNLKY
jgi:hypothetical protein